MGAAVRIGSEVRLKGLVNSARLNGVTATVLPKASQWPGTIWVRSATGEDFTVKLANFESITGFSGGGFGVSDDKPKATQEPRESHKDARDRKSRSRSGRGRSRSRGRRRDDSRDRSPRRREKR